MSRNHLDAVKERVLNHSSASDHSEASYSIFRNPVLRSIMDKNRFNDKVQNLRRIFSNVFANESEAEGDELLVLTEEQRIIKEYFTAPEEFDSKFITFTLSFIALAAKLIKVDGEVNQDEYRELIESFSVPQVHFSKIEDLFVTAYQEEDHWEIYGYKILSLFPEHQALHLQLLNTLLKIALADAPLNLLEMNWLKKMATIVNCSEQVIVELLRIQLLPDTSNPYQVLGIQKGDSMDDLNRAYRELARGCHPDNLSNLNYVQEYNDIAEEKFILITQCYNFVKRQLK